MTLVDALSSGQPVIAAELRPPRAELAAAEGMDAWIDTYHAVRGLTRQGTFVFLTDSAVGADEDTAADVLLACGEAAANAVEHAFPDDPGELTVQLRLSADRELTVRVADTGRWRRVPAPGDRGRGLPLMHAVMD